MVARYSSFFQVPHRVAQLRRCASFHIQNGQNSVSALQSSVVTCTKRLSSNSWKYCAHWVPGAAAAWTRTQGSYQCRVDDARLSVIVT